MCSLPCHRNRQLNQERAVKTPPRSASDFTLSHTQRTNRNDLQELERRIVELENENEELRKHLDGQSGLIVQGTADSFEMEIPHPQPLWMARLGRPQPIRPLSEDLQEVKEEPTIETESEDQDEMRPAETVAQDSQPHEEYRERRKAKQAAAEEEQKQCEESQVTAVEEEERDLQALECKRPAQVNEEKKIAQVAATRDKSAEKHGKPDVALEWLNLCKHIQKYCGLFNVTPDEMRLQQLIQFQIRQYLIFRGNAVDDRPPRWRPDACCKWCKGKFQFYFRDHHCRLCGHAICNDCACLVDFYNFEIRCSLIGKHQRTNISRKTQIKCCHACAAVANIMREEQLPRRVGKPAESESAVKSRAVG